VSLKKHQRQDYEGAREECLKRERELRPRLCIGWNNLRGGQAPEPKKRGRRPLRGQSPDLSHTTKYVRVNEPLPGEKLLTPIIDEELKAKVERELRRATSVRKSRAQNIDGKPDQARDVRENGADGSRTIQRNLGWSAPKIQRSSIVDDIDAWRLSKLMGHASIANTTKYVRMSPEPLKDAWRGKR
jgi:hypothetical protein